MPKVTIDLGDGRVIKRTLAGNTVMYFCTADGSVIDAFPGVYTAQDFLREARPTMDFLRSAPGDPGEVNSWHQKQVRDVIHKAQTTISKMVVESPLLNALGLRPRLSPASQEAQPVQDDPLADPKAAFEAVSAKIEDRSKEPASAERIRASFSRGPHGREVTPDEIARLALEMDSRANVNLVRPAVHLLLSTFDALPNVEECRDDIYKRVLHIPIDDPNLGLADVLIPGTPQ